MRWYGLLGGSEMGQSGAWAAVGVEQMNLGT